MRVLRLVTGALVVAAAVVGSVERAAANGGKGKVTTYQASVTMDDQGREVVFSAQLERVLFSLTSVQSKYKLVRIKIDNKSKKDLALSLEKDQIALRVGSETLPGILDLGKQDPAMWDALGPAIRDQIAYPAKVKAGEEENIFVFIAKPALSDLPRDFRYSIESLAEKPVVLVDRTAVPRS
jgi:hypothetical protein